MTAPITSYLSLALAMLILGTSVVASKVITETMPIHTAMTIRLALASIVMLGLVRVTGGIPRLPMRLHGVLILQALTGMVTFNVLLLLGLGMTTAMASGVITSTTPAVIAVLSLGLGDRLRLAGWFGIGLAVAGTVLVNLFTAQESASASRPVLGATVVFLAVIAEALYTVLGKIAAPALRPIPMATLVTLYGLLLFLPLAATDVATFRPAEVPSSGWVALIFLALFVTIGAFVLWFHGLRQVPACTAGAYTGLIPVGTIIATVLFLDEAVTWVHLAGVAVVMVGIVLVTQSIRPVRVAIPPGTVAGVPTWTHPASPSPPAE